MCLTVFWLFWLSYQYLPIDWLERLLWGSLIVARGSSPESPDRRVHMIFLVILYVLLHCFIMYLCCLLPQQTYFPTVTARYSLFVLKVLLNPKQTNKQCVFNATCSALCSCRSHYTTELCRLSNSLFGPMEMEMENLNRTPTTFTCAITVCSGAILFTEYRARLWLGLIVAVKLTVSLLCYASAPVGRRH